MGDWLRDKTISHRRLLQTNTDTFPCKSRLQKWDNHPDGIYGLCKLSREVDLKLLGRRPSHVTKGHLQNSGCRLQDPTTSVHNVCFQQVQDDMSKTLSVNKEWEVFSRGTEISQGKFVSEYFKSLTQDIQTGVVSDEDTSEIRETSKEKGIKKVRETRIGLQGRFTHGRRKGGSKVLLTQETRRLENLFP